MLAEWHITPDHIINNWTDELLDLMVGKFLERKKREIDAIQGKTGEIHNLEPGTEVVSDTELFRRMGIEVKKEKKSGD